MLNCYIRQWLRAGSVFLILLAAPRDSIAVPELVNMPFCMDSDFVEMSGASLVAQMPDVDQVLYDKGPGDSVWQTPMQARVENGVPQIWYLRFDYDSEVVDRTVKSTLCLNEIVNGNWTPKEISQSDPPWGGSDTNNVVMRPSSYTPSWGNFGPLQIVEDASGGLMNLYWDKPNVNDQSGVMRATGNHSGLSFDKVAGTVITQVSDSFTVSRVGNEWRMYQQVLQPWAGKVNPDSIDQGQSTWRKRVIALRTSNDTSSWTNVDVDNPMLEPDSIDIADDDQTQFYNLKTFPYGDKIGGILWKYYADPNLPYQHGDTYRYEMLFSENGVNWERQFRDTDIGFSSYADPIEWNGRLDFATQGRPGTTEVGDTMLKGWRSDRMVAVEGAGGEVRTSTFYFPSNGIDINVDTSAFGASIDVTVCDTYGTPIVGWTPFHIQNNNQTWEQLPWSAGHEPVSLKVDLYGAAKVFGIRARPSGGMGVPEPSTFAIAAIILPFICLRRCRGSQTAGFRHETRSYTISKQQVSLQANCHDCRCDAAVQYLAAIVLRA